MRHDLLKRVQIVVCWAQRKGQSEIENEVGVVVNTIKKWKTRWEAHYNELLTFEEGPSKEGVRANF